jgi:hypothetical protein
MKSKLILVLPATIIILFLFWISYLSVKSKESQPDLTVINFVEKLKIGDSNGAAELLTNSPDYLDQVLTLELNKKEENSDAANLKSNIENSSEKSDLPNQPDAVIKKKNKFNNQELLRIVTESFQNRSDFDRIKGVIKYKNEAKVVASFLRKGFANTDYKFLLIKEETEWKIFNIYLDNGAEFDLFKYWAVDRSLMSISNKNDVSQNSEPTLIVQKFMKYVAENKLAEANSLTKTEQEVSGMTKQREELASKLDWAQVFKERDFTLEKIVSNDISGKSAKVKTLLSFGSKYDVNMEAIFSLKNLNDQWFIYDIEFVTDRTN